MEKNSSSSGGWVFSSRTLFDDLRYFTISYFRPSKTNEQIYLTICQIFQSLGVNDKQTVVTGNTTSNKDGLQRDDDGKDMTVVWKCALIIGSIYMFYLLNNLMNFCQVSTVFDHIRWLHCS